MLQSRSIAFANLQCRELLCGALAYNALLWIMFQCIWRESLPSAFCFDALSSTLTESPSPAFLACESHLSANIGSNHPPTPGHRCHSRQCHHPHRLCWKKEYFFWKVTFWPSLSHCWFFLMIIMHLPTFLSTIIIVKLNTQKLLKEMKQFPGVDFSSRALLLHLTH